MDITLDYSEKGTIGEKRVEEIRYHLDETEVELKVIMRKFRSIVKKQSTYSKTLCFLKLNFETGVYICVSYDTYDDIENDVFSIYRYVGSKIDTIKCQRSKAAKKILEMSKN